jgi:hypothetical protein
LSACELDGDLIVRRRKAAPKICTHGIFHDAFFVGDTGAVLEIEPTQIRLLNGSLLVKTKSRLIRVETKFGTVSIPSKTCGIVYCCENGATVNNLAGRDLELHYRYRKLLSYRRLSPGVRAVICTGSGFEAPDDYPMIEPESEPEPPMPPPKPEPPYTSLIIGQHSPVYAPAIYTEWHHEQRRVLDEFATRTLGLARIELQRLKPLVQARMPDVDLLDPPTYHN